MRTNRDTIINVVLWVLLSFVIYLLFESTQDVEVSPAVDALVWGFTGWLIVSGAQRLLMRGTHRHRDMRRNVRSLALRMLTLSPLAAVLWGLSQGVILSVIAGNAGIRQTSTSFAEVFEVVAIHAFAVVALLALPLSLTLQRTSFELREQQLIAENALQAARLDLLRSQLDPHFLFNVLNSIVELVHEDADRADNMICQLSGLLRGSLTLHASFVTFSQELAWVSTYLELQKTRFEGKLDVQVNVENIALDISVPPFILQPLLENAIKYSARCEAPVKISLDIHSDNDAVNIVIRNPLPHLVEHVQAAKGFGVGLSNVQQRLSLLYGDRAKLSLIRREISAEVILRLPRLEQTS